VKAPGSTHKFEVETSGRKLLAYSHPVIVGLHYANPPAPATLGFSLDNVFRLCLKDPVDSTSRV
jgi:hypothetical protein